MSDTTLYLCDHLAIFTIHGEDAETFLQGQLTSDLRNLAPGDNRLAMHLNLKGRAVVSMRLFRTADGFDAVLPKTMLEAALKGLQKYALFSKATLEADPSRRVLGMTDAASAESFAGYPLHGSPAPRWMALVDQNASLPDSIGESQGWLQTDIDAGEAHIYPGGEDHWLPQALNYDVMDGVHFDKGCFLGQEVVARMHFKGQMKQRLLAWQWSGDQIPEVGTTLRNEDGKAVGELVQAVHSDSHIKALVVTRRDHSGDLLLDDQPLNAEPLSLPYAVPDK